MSYGGWSFDPDDTATEVVGGNDVWRVGETLADLFRDIRFTDGRTAWALSLSLGAYPAFWSRVEVGYRAGQLDRHTLLRVARVFGVSVARLESAGRESVRDTAAGERLRARLQQQRTENR